MDQDRLWIGDQIMGELGRRAERLLTGLETDAHHGRNIWTILALPIDDLQAVALAAYDRGFGKSVRGMGYDCYRLCEAFPELRQKYEPVLEALHRGEDPRLPDPRCPNADGRIFELRESHGERWYGRELLRYAEEQGIIEAVDQDGETLYRPRFQ